MSEWPIPAGAMLDSMPIVTSLLNAAVADDPKAAGELLPLVYDELCKLAD